MSKVLGLDIGANSVGWALLAPDENTIIDMGVRVFQEGVSSINTAKEISRHAEWSALKVRCFKTPNSSYINR